MGYAEEIATPRSLSTLVPRVGVEHRPLVLVVGGRPEDRADVARRLADVFLQALAATCTFSSQRVLLFGTTAIRLEDDAALGLLVEGDCVLQPARAGSRLHADLMVPVFPEALVEPSLELYRARRSGRWGAIVAEAPAAARWTGPATLGISDVVVLPLAPEDAGTERTAAVVRALAAESHHGEAWVALSPAAQLRGRAEALLAMVHDVTSSGFALRFAA